MPVVTLPCLQTPSSVWVAIFTVITCSPSSIIGESVSFWCRFGQGTKFWQRCKRKSAWSFWEMFSSWYKRKQEEKAPLVTATFFSAWDTAQENVDACHPAAIKVINHQRWKNRMTGGAWFMDACSPAPECTTPSKLLCEIKKLLLLKPQEWGILLFTAKCVSLILYRIIFTSHYQNSMRQVRGENKSKSDRFYHKA